MRRAAASAWPPRSALTLLGWLWRAQWRTQPGRSIAAVVAIAIGVALALAIHLVNHSALAEFDDAMAVVNGDAQMQITPLAGTLDERLYAEVAADPALLASPVIDAVFAVADRDETTLRVLGLDVFRAAQVSPALVPSVADSADGGSGSPLFGDDTIFLSSAAASALGLAPGDIARLRAGARVAELRVAGTVAGVAGGQRLAVMDIGALQWRLDWLGRLSRIDLRLADGHDRQAARERLTRLLGARAALSSPDAGRQRMSNLSRAYRVNLNVLALVALFTGGFIVYSTLALAIARQQHELAVLRVLG
ncbi:MAG: ABC transporter permease, partial [Burkholderiales bacterium]|nr:ABC transporter permease [Burkholderiales bacterium]